MVSVCVTTYNGEKHIEEQLRSILSQLGDTDEVIVSDDGSDDHTLSIIHRIADSRVSIYHNTGKKGVIHNVENALGKAKGDYIFLSDQDDVWLPTKVACSLKGLQEAPLVVSDCYVTDENLQIVHDSFFAVNRSKQNKYLALLKNPYLGCCMAFHRSLLELVLPFPDHIPMHDIWIGNVAAFRRSTKFLPDKLIYYRRHGNNVTTTSEKSKNGFIDKVIFRMHVLKNLLIKR